MTTKRHPSGAVALTPPELSRLLRRQLRHGLRASRLLDCPELIDFLYPGGQGHLSTSCSFDRALQAEAKVAEAITRIGGKPAQALRIVCGLDDGTLGLKLVERRKLAGHVLSRPGRPVSPATFVKNYERLLLRDLAVEMWRDAAGHIDN